MLNKIQIAYSGTGRLEYSLKEEVNERICITLNIAGFGYQGELAVALPGNETAFTRLRSYPYDGGTTERVALWVNTQNIKGTLGIQLNNFHTKYLTANNQLLGLQVTTVEQPKQLLKEEARIEILKIPEPRYGIHINEPICSDIRELRVQLATKGMTITGGNLSGAPLELTEDGSYRPNFTTVWEQAKPAPLPNGFENIQRFILQFNYLNEMQEANSIIHPVYSAKELDWFRTKLYCGNKEYEKQDFVLNTCNGKIWMIAQQKNSSILEILYSVNGIDWAAVENGTSERCIEEKYLYSPALIQKISKGTEEQYRVYFMPGSKYHPEGNDEFAAFSFWLNRPGFDKEPSLPPCPEKRWGYGCAFLPGTENEQDPQILLIGGIDTDNNGMATCLLFNTRTKEWSTEMDPANNQRAFFTPIVVTGEAGKKELYISGGKASSNSAYLLGMERLYYETGSWQWQPVAFSGGGGQQEELMMAVEDGMEQVMFSLTEIAGNIIYILMTIDDKKQDVLKIGKLAVTAVENATKTFSLGEDILLHKAGWLLGGDETHLETIAFNNTLFLQTVDISWDNQVKKSDIYGAKFPAPKN